MGGDKGRKKGVLEGLLEAGIIIHGCNNLTLGS